MKHNGSRMVLRDHEREQVDRDEAQAYVKTTNWNRIVDCANIRAAICPEPEHPAPLNPNTRSGMIEAIRIVHDRQTDEAMGEVTRFMDLAETETKPHVKRLYLDLAEQMRRKVPGKIPVAVSRLNKGEAKLVLGAMRQGPSVDLQKRGGHIVLHMGNR